MFEAMASARIGMASRGEDESVLRLEARAADLLGTEAAAFLPNVTSANLLALLGQAPRGTAVLMDRMAHVNVVEWYGITAWGGLVPLLLDADGGRLDLADVDRAFTETNGGRAPRVGAVVLENTHNFAGGTALSAADTAAVVTFAHRHGAPVHLDGARGAPTRSNELVRSATTSASAGSIARANSPPRASSRWTPCWSGWRTTIAGPARWQRRSRPWTASSSTSRPSRRTSSTSG
jgi:threonine aldolase